MSTPTYPLSDLEVEAEAKKMILRTRFHTTCDRCGAGMCALSLNFPPHYDWHGRRGSEKKKCDRCTKRIARWEDSLTCPFVRLQGLDYCKMVPEFILNSLRNGDKELVLFERE